jgi:hypothetical protein
MDARFGGFGHLSNILAEQPVCELVEEELDWYRVFTPGSDIASCE